MMKHHNKPTILFFGRGYGSIGIGNSRIFGDIPASLPVIPPDDVFWMVCFWGGSYHHTSSPGRCFFEA